MKSRLVAWTVVLWVSAALPQVIEFESNGLKYQTLTRNGVTVMYAHLDSHVGAYSILQVAVANGSAGPYVIRPEDFTFTRQDGTAVRAAAARSVVAALIEKGTRGDVIRLVSNYEAAMYGLSRIRPTNGYEQRRQAALAEVGSTRLKAAAAASAIALVQTKLAPGQSTDGAIFFPVDGRPLRPGRLIVRTNTSTFEFNPEQY
jgi:hypothetical protein